MGLWSRLKLIFRSKASRAADRLEDPRETLDYAYQRQLDLLQQVKRGLAEVATSRKRIEIQRQQLERSSEKLQGQAQRALEQKREDLAREALVRRVAIQGELGDLEEQHRQLRAEEDNMTQQARRLETRVQQFRTRKETIKASYTAAEAQTRVGEAVTGISKEMGDLGLALQRAEDKIAQSQARAGALEELTASGALDDLSTPTDRIEAELNRSAATSEVELELARLKQELGGGEDAAQLEEGKPDEPGR